jgi:VCBS repeat-containing protein
MLARVTSLSLTALALVFALGATPAVAVEAVGPAPDLVSGVVVSAEPRVVPETGVIITDVKLLGTVPTGGASLTSFEMRGGVVGDVGMWTEQFVDLSVGDTVIAGVSDTAGQVVAVTAPIATTGLSALATAGLTAGSSGVSAGYMVNGMHWPDYSLPVPYYVNLTGLPAGSESAITAAAQTWESDIGSRMDYSYMGTTGTIPRLSTEAADGVNVVGARNLGATGTLAQCTYWYNPVSLNLSQFDIIYNTAYSYATDGRPSAYDVQGIGTHELGHTLWLGDLKAAEDAVQVMYESATPGNTGMRTLKWGDIAGIRSIYPASAPVATADSATVAEDTTLTVAAPGVLANDADPQGGPLTASLVTGPSHGTLVLASSGGYTYRADPDWFGTDSFSYRAFNTNLYSAPVAVTITVTPVNDAPVSAADAATIAMDATLTVPAPGVLGNDTDVDGDSLVTSLTVEPQHGELTLAGNGSYRYAPAPGFSGTDTFTYRAFDGAAYSAPAVVTITTTELNAAPLANADSATVAENTTLTVVSPGVLANDTDADGNPLTAEMVAAPAHGALSLSSDGSYTYHPTTDWFGTDVFTYRASDAAIYSAPATVTITVTAVAVPAPPAKVLPRTAISVTSPSRVKRARSFYISGRLSPAHAASTRVYLRFERYYRHRWRVVKRTSVFVSAGSGGYRYRAKLSPSGSWRVIVSRGGDGVVDTGAASATRRFSVR